MANLILLTNSFPYGNWEPYLETEVNYYDKFDAVHIFSLQIRKEHREKMRKMPFDKFYIHPVFYAPGWVYLLNAVTALGDINLYREIFKLLRQKRFSLRRLIKLFIYISRSHYEARKIKKYLKTEGITENPGEGIIYSYRFEYQPYVGILLQKYLPNYKVVARGHGYDLYEERHREVYIPLRELLLEKLEYMYPICDAGRDYLAEKFPKFADKLSVKRLGTLDHGICPAEKDRVLRLVSCSNVVPVKRIHLIIEALAQITDIEISWTHFGEGILMDEMKKKAEALPQNIHWDFRGFVDNANLQEEYSKNPYHIFLNVSESEGIPVSIMEVMSFGIPCIATDVGGTKEIVTHRRNGILLSSDFSPTELADYIHEFANMSKEDYQNYRNNARDDWSENYNAQSNYISFNQQLYLLSKK